MSPSHQHARKKPLQLARMGYPRKLGERARVEERAAARLRARRRREIKLERW